jgi:hypothetical protein
VVAFVSTSASKPTVHAVVMRMLLVSALL